MGLARGEASLTGPSFDYRSTGGGARAVCRRGRRRVAEPAGGGPAADDALRPLEARLRGVCPHGLPRADLATSPHHPPFLTARQPHLRSPATHPTGPSRSSCTRGFSALRSSRTPASGAFARATRCAPAARLSCSLPAGARSLWHSRSPTLRHRDKYRAWSGVSCIPPRTQSAPS